MQHTFTLTRNPRSKNIRLSVLADGSLKVTAPHYTKESHIKEFITSQQMWIKKQQQKIKNQPQLESQTHIYIFGKKYLKVLASPPAYPLGVHILRNNLIVSGIPTTSSPQTWESKHDTKVHTFLKKTAHQYFLAQTQNWAKKMDISYGRVTLKKQKTRWGSCSSEGNLNFNWQLVHFEPKIVDYVIIHELAHRIHMNHSAKFWVLVAKYDPHYKQHLSVLKKYTLG